MPLSPQTVLRFLTWWPPYLAAGISVRSIDLDRGEVVTQLKLRPYNRNYFGTHFGGSLFAMCDPFFVFILAHFLGKGYYIWDLESKIEFRKATAEPVFATFRLTPERAKEIAEEAASGQKVTPVFQCDIVTASGTVVAHVEKVLYVKKKKAKVKAES